MRTPTKVPLFAVLVLSLALGVACGRPATGAGERSVASRTAQTSPAPERKPADARELAGYAERERKVQGLEKFAGGRLSNSDLTTIVLVLLIVVLILIIV